MSVKPVPDGYHTVTPYLVVPNVGRVIDFLKQTFHAQEAERMTLADGRIMHAEVRIGDSNIMMGEPQPGQAPVPAMLYIYVSDTDATYQRALAAGATSVMEPADQFYGDRNAGVKDEGGNVWWIATHFEDVPQSELLRRAQAAADEKKKA